MKMKVYGLCKKKKKKIVPIDKIRAEKKLIIRTKYKKKNNKISTGATKYLKKKQKNLQHFF